MPVVTTVLGSDINEQPRNAALRAQIAPALQRCARVVAVSGALGERLVELGVPRERVVVQLNAVDGARFAIRDRAEPRRRFGVPADAKVVLYAGYHVPEKGVDVLVEAMAHLDRAGRRDVHLMMVGGGELLEPLRAKVSALGLGRSRAAVRLGAARGDPGVHGRVRRVLPAEPPRGLPERRPGGARLGPPRRRDPGRRRAGARARRGTGATASSFLPAIPGRSGARLARALDTAWEPEALRGSVGALSWDVVGERYHALLKEVLGERRRGPG